MFNQAKKIREKYIREEMWPSIFCTGCGIGNILNYTLRAIDSIGLDIDQTVFCSGIGCSSRLPGYIEADGLHTTHGRAIAFATGVKVYKPELSVIVFTGDGDMARRSCLLFVPASAVELDPFMDLWPSSSTRRPCHRRSRSSPGPGPPGPADLLRAVRPGVRQAFFASTRRSLMRPALPLRSRRK